MSPALRPVLLACVTGLLLAGAAAGAAPAKSPVAEAQALVDRGEAAAALALLDPWLARQRQDATGHLVRSSAHFLLGDLDAGRKDLDRALELDPTLRQGWLNRAALAMADRRYDAALEDLERARQLDPAAEDNDINLGAVRLLLGELAPATEHFRSYLASQGEDAGAYYLVATNYALAGYAAFALEHLARAVEIDERTRRRARVDANFAELESHPRYQEILHTDSWRAPPGALTAERSFAGAAYAAGQGPLLPAVLEALHAQRIPYESAIEVAPEWALVWGDLRIKLSDGPTGDGVVQLTAPPGRYGQTQWEEVAKRLLDAVFVQLQRQAVRRGNR